MTASESIGPEWVLAKRSAAEDGKDHAALLESARRVWPNLRVFARRAIAGEMSVAEKDQFSAEVWEEVLSDAAKVVSRPGSSIINVEAYLTTSFRYRLLRRAKRESKLRERLQFLPPEELIEAEGSGVTSPQLSIEDKLQIEQISGYMDQWTLTVWNLTVYGMSGKEIGKAVGMEPEQVKQKFRHELKKIRMRLQRKSRSRKNA